jgi:hypothetical protein
MLSRYMPVFRSNPNLFPSLQQGEVTESSALLDKAKSYKDYYLQNRLHFRNHAFAIHVGVS